jgi:putative phosphoesterase
MRILLVADIHSNWPALVAIRERFDVCLFLGDLVDYGTDPVPCVDWVRRNATVGVRGNHDHAVAQRVIPRQGSGYRGWAAVTRPLHWNVMSRADLFFLARLPVTRTVRLEGTTLHLVHATPRDPLDEYLTDDPEAWTARLQSVEADFVCVGHTHLPFHMKLDRTQVINPGSVGQPRDGDPRAAYAIIDNGRVELKRVAYDIDATIRQMRSCGLDAETLAVAESALRTGGHMPESARTPEASTPSAE